MIAKTVPHYWLLTATPTSNTGSAAGLMVPGYTDLRGHVREKK
jgi:hypothetical protein